MGNITEQFLAAIQRRCLSAEEERKLLEIDSVLKNIDVIYPMKKKEYDLPMVDTIGKTLPYPNTLKGNLEC